MKEMSWRHIISKTFLPCQYLPFCSVQNVEDFSRKINYFLVTLLCCFTPRETRHFVQVSKLFHTLQNASLPVVEARSVGHIISIDGGSITGAIEYRQFTTGVWWLDGAS